MTRKLCALMIFTLAIISLFAIELPPRLTNLPCAQYFNDPEFPADWTQTSTDGIAQNRWFLYDSSAVGGEPYELLCYNTAGVGITRLISPQLNTAGINEIVVQFLYIIGLYDLGTVFKLQYSHDLVNWYDTSWSVFTPGYNQGGHVSVRIENLNAPATYIAWTLEGNQLGIEGALLDNLIIHLPLSPEVQISDSGELSWDTVPFAGYYDIYGADDPYGAFSLVATVVDPFWLPDLGETKKFYHVKAIY